MSEILTSVGEAGTPDFERSEGRGYWTLEERVCDIDILRERWRWFAGESSSLGRRRSVLRAECSNDVVSDLIQNDLELPVEVLLPINLVKNDQAWIVYLAENIHRSELSENYLAMRNFWRNATIGRSDTAGRISPLQRVLLRDVSYQLTCDLDDSDQENLYQLWKPFGWKKDGIDSFIRSNRESTWFSGVRELSSGELVAASMGESIRFASTLMVEGTEYSTLSGYEGRGLGSLAVIGLHAQILKDTYYTDGEIPLITAEFDLSSRSDVVGFNAGMVVPFVDNANGVNQVLRKNVSVLDRKQPNDLNWRELGELRHKYRDAYRNRFRYWRDFVPGVLPRTSIVNWYKFEDVEMILEHYE